jgi:type I restriction enzyme M protein
MDSTSGRVAVILPQGSLFRSGAEGRIRKFFIEEDLIECVIGMAPNLFYGTGLAPCIIILQAKKSKERVKKVLIINSENLFKRGRNQNTLENEHLSYILKLYSEFKSVEGFSYLSSLTEISERNFSLNIPLYVAQVRNHDELSLDACSDDLKVANQQVDISRVNLMQELEKWGLNVPN